MENTNPKDEFLFEQLKRNKRRKRRKVFFTVLILLILAAVGITVTVRVLRARVQMQFAASTVEVKSYQAEKGRISTTVSGSGSLSYMDYEEVTVPDGVEITEILVSTGDNVTAGTALATVDQNTVLKALADTQSNLDSLAKQINSAKNSSSSSYVSSTVAGRIKAVYINNGDSVLDVMSEHGALVLISLDGCMTFTVDAELAPGKSVQVSSGDRRYTGTVSSCAAGKSVITLTDDGPVYGAEASVIGSDNQILGTGTLEIRNPLAVTGYNGTAGWVSARENQLVYSGSSLFTLNSTQSTISYESLLRQRSEAEQTMHELVDLLQLGVVTAPFDGIVTAVAEGGTDAMAAAASAYMDTASAASGGSSLVTMAPDKQVCISVAVDETDILSLELGQSAEVKISSIGDDVYPGKVTEISKIGTSASGVTQYTAVVTLDKAPQMLSGMTASVDIQIQGVDDVVLIPVDALHQTRATSYVFTGYNEEQKEYTGMVEVITGSSNSKFVEIVSGLKPGDTVYYTEKTSNNPFSMMPMGGNIGGYSNFGNNRNTGSRSGTNSGGNGAGNSSGNRSGSSRQGG